VDVPVERWFAVYMMFEFPDAIATSFVYVIPSVRNVIPVTFRVQVAPLSVLIYGPCAPVVVDLRVEICVVKSEVVSIP
jgi:hypothetical protein